MSRNRGTDADIKRKRVLEKKKIDDDIDKTGQLDNKFIVVIIENRM